MPKRTDISSILIIGAGPIVIGQACEFDYSGVQACKALKAEGYRIILVNSNPATIMTDPNFADATYIEPVNWKTIEKIIAKELPDAILPTMGGQTALNCALDLSKNGILKKFNVQLIGANQEAIDKAEDREKFKTAMKKIGLNCPKSKMAHSLEEAIQIQPSIGFPIIIRPSFTLGGAGGGIAYNQDEFEEIVNRGLDASPTHEVLIEQSVLGWKEFEMEVVRDKNDNCIIICSIENFDPMGIHTGDSITVAPAQTLTDKEFQIMRNASIAVLREIGVETGGSNVQFAVNPENGQLIVIEMNPRVSRSSALASKATGFPIAKVAALLAVGYTLDELRNDITDGIIPSSFEPTIDYIVTKIPRFSFEKFPQADPLLTTQMKSVGEVMAIGRTFKESLQKALRGLEIGANGLDSLDLSEQEIQSTLSLPLSDRIFRVADAFRHNISIDEVFNITKIDRWFLIQIKELIDDEKNLASMSFDKISDQDLLSFKKNGFSDKKIAQLLKVSEDEVRNLRWKLSIHPKYKRIDTCAAEFDSNTGYFYSTYEDYCESSISEKKKIIILGGGPNRIGQGIEFDYCCVHAAFAISNLGYESIMINCNPETVSTDYDSSDKLYFEPITLEDVLEICKIEKPQGLIVQLGGQTPLKIANELNKNHIPIIGTSSKMIDVAEDREKFKELLETLSLRQPENSIINDFNTVESEAEKIGFPMVVRPSYVLGGRAMAIVNDHTELETYLNTIVDQFKDNPILLDKFLSDSIEVDVDALCDGENVTICGIMEHIEEAGIHSGDSACAIPPFSLSSDVIQLIKNATVKLGLSLHVIGLMNIQFAIKGKEIYILEVNPRASRTVPFVSKAIGLAIAKIAVEIMLGKKINDSEWSENKKSNHFSVKEAVFPFIKFPGVDTLLGPEMKSTGEVMGIGKNFEEAFLKSQIAAGYDIPKNGNVFVSVRDDDKKDILKIISTLVENNFKIFATTGTAKFLLDNNIKVTSVNKVLEGRPHIVDMIKNGSIDMIINTTNSSPLSIKDSFSIRRTALQYKVTYFTTIAAAKVASNVISNLDDYNVLSLQNLHQK